MLDKDMDKAKEGIDKAVTNLRDGVDDIRTALREERPVRSELGLHEIQAVLEKFQVNHNIKIRMEQSGNLDYIGFEIWQCIYDNLEEVLTNILKHSNATQFKLTIKILPKIIHVEYGDNGKTEGKFFKSLGLEGIEERTIKCGGRCFFEKTSQEFLVTNIFTY
jgi:signal transduction histidine kinase